MNAAIAHHISDRKIFPFFTNRGLADFQTARSEIRKLAARHDIRLTSAAKLKRVSAKVRKRALLEAAGVRAHGGYCRRHTDSCLRKAADLFVFTRRGTVREIPLAMREGEAFARDVPNDLSALRCSLNPQ